MNYFNSLVRCGNGLTCLDRVNSKILTYLDGQLTYESLAFCKVGTSTTITEITTNTSRKLIIPCGQPILIIDENLNTIRRQPILGDTIPRIREVTCGNKRFSHIELPKLPEHKYEFRDIIPVDGQFGYLNGVYIGDGWASNTEVKHAICLASEDSVIPNKVRDIVNGYLVKGNLHISTVQHIHEFEGKESYSEKHTWHSNRFARYFEENLGTGPGAANKRLPPYWVETSELFRWGLLAGLIDTDGSIMKNYEKKQTGVNYTTISKDLANDIYELAGSLNLTATITNSTTPKGKDCYVITFTQESIVKMKEHLPLSKKRARLNNYVPNRTHDRNKYTPKLLGDRLRELRNNIGSPTLFSRKGEPLYSTRIEEQDIRKRRSLYQILYRIEKNNGAITKNTAREIIALGLGVFCAPFWKKWGKLVAIELFDWELITDIKHYEISEPMNVHTVNLKERQAIVDHNGIIC